MGMVMLTPFIHGHGLSFYLDLRGGSKSPLRRFCAMRRRRWLAAALTLSALARGFVGTRGPPPAVGPRLGAVSDAVADLAPPVDLRKSPWEALHEAFQAEGRRCWGQGFDGKVPGYIADAWPVGLGCRVPGMPQQLEPRELGRAALQA